MEERVRQSADGKIRLDLGSGARRDDGWISIDNATERRRYLKWEQKHELKPDIKADIRKLPFPDNWADEARAIHVIEHFYVWEAPALLEEWTRVLKPGGKLAIECPCFDKIIQLALVPRIPPSHVYWGLYGDPRYKDEAMMHRWCYTERQLLGLFSDAGLVEIQLLPVRFHEPIRDMRMIGRKPMPESVLVAP